MKEKILDRLRKLIRHEQSARAIGNMKEAAAFAMKIQELLDQHDLSLGDIDIEESRASVKGECFRDLPITQVWQKNFLHALAELHGCRMILDSGGTAMIVGSDFDREIVIELFQYFEALGRHLADRHIRHWQQTPDYTRKRKKSFYTRRYKMAFLYGYQEVVIERMTEQKEADKAAASNETALIYIGNKLADATAWVNNNLKIHAVKDKGKKLRMDAYLHGRMAGRSVALTTKTVNG